MVEDSLVKGEVLGNVLKIAIELLSPGDEMQGSFELESL